MENKLRVGIIGATGMVGQKFITLLNDHPWYEIVCLAASPRSAGKTYHEAVGGRWAQTIEIPEQIKNMKVMDGADVEHISQLVDFIFCAVDMEKETIRQLEEAYAKADIPVVSNNSAHRWTEDVPMVVPEINNDHIEIINAQRKRLGTDRGFIAVKPNCSIQSYVPVIKALMEYQPREVNVCTYQAISGAAKNFESWPEMVDNIIPYIGGEEEKSEKEPMKIWGKIDGDKIVPAEQPLISAQCIRVPAADGHLAAVSVKFEEKPEISKVIDLINNYQGRPQELELPSAPKQFMKYMEEADRPQTRLDRDYEKGMGVTVGRFREDNLYDYKFVCLSHNTLRGAAGGAVLIAELLTSEGYIVRKS